MPHPLAARWTSQFFFDAGGVFINDTIGDFDLQAIANNGAIGAGCTHGGQNISGRAKAISGSQPLTHVVVMEHADNTRYRGTAIQDAAGNITKITGTVIFPNPVQFKHARAAGSQNEATWVATKG